MWHGTVNGKNWNGLTEYVNLILEEYTEKNPSATFDDYKRTFANGFDRWGPRSKSQLLYPKRSYDLLSPDHQTKLYSDHRFNIDGEIYYLTNQWACNKSDNSIALVEKDVYASGLGFSLTRFDGLNNNHNFAAGAQGTGNGNVVHGGVINKSIQSPSANGNLGVINRYLAKVLIIYNASINDPNHESRAWDICHNEFVSAINSSNPDFDNLALHLGMYLSNWGMYRGSAFIRNYNYREYIPIVKLVLNPKYKKLLDIEMSEYINSVNGLYNMDLLDDLVEEVKTYLMSLRNQINSGVRSDISQTLITKILLATLGCIPAYDQYFCKGIKKYKTASGTFNSKSVEQLACFYQNNYVKLEKCRKKMINLENNNKQQYSQAKILDMFFFGIGIN